MKLNYVILISEILNKDVNNFIRVPVNKSTKSNSKNNVPRDIYYQTTIFASQSVQKIL